MRDERVAIVIGETSSCVYDLKILNETFRARSVNGRGIEEILSSKRSAGQSFFVPRLAVTSKRMAVSRNTSPALSSTLQKRLKCSH